MDYQNLKLRFTTWQTYAFLFSILGLLSQHYGWLDFQKELGFYQDIILPSVYFSDGGQHTRTQNRIKEMLNNANSKDSQVVIAESFPERAVFTVVKNYFLVTLLLVLVNF